MMKYGRSVGVWFAACLLVVGSAGVVGCGGDNGERQFQCEDHLQCLDHEACIGEVCVDAPEAGDECPEEHEGEEYDGMGCHEGQWIEGAAEAPSILSVTADLESVDPGQTVELAVEVEWEGDGDLEYAWSASEGWELVDDDAAQVDLVAPDEPGNTGTIEVVVTDPFGNSDEGDVEVSTVAIDPPQIQSVSADPPTVDPGESVELTVEVESDVQEELEYAWSAPEGWELVDDDAAQVELVAINEPDVTGTIEVAVTDPFGGSDEDSVDITTHDPEGPQIESIEAQPEEVLPGGEQTVTVEATHPMGQDLEYDWDLPEDWEALSDLDGNVIELRAPDENSMGGDVEVTVIDEFDKEIMASTTVRTEDLFCGGDGTESEPWEVCSAKFVNRVGYYEDYLGDYFELTEDVDMADLDEEFTVIGDEDAPFAGVFEAQGRVIENLTVDADGDEVGLFGRIDEGGEVRDLVLESAYVRGEESVGALVGRNEGTITGARVDGDVDGVDEVGGLVGRNLGTIAESSVAVDVTAEGDDVGGLVGLNIEDVATSVARGDVEGDDSVGGLVGRNVGTIEDAYATGDVEGDGEVGGLVGDNGSSGSIARTFSTGAVDALFDDGGLVGRNSAGDDGVADSFWNVESSGMDDSAAGTGWESTDEFRFKRNYPDSWAFYPDDDFIWVMRENEDGEVYPSLEWEVPCDDNLECDVGVCAQGGEICVGCAVWVADKEEDALGGGTGTDDDPWRLCTPEHYANLWSLMSSDDDYLDDSYALHDDIDAEGQLDLEDPYFNGEFTGVFDGKGHWIEGVFLMVNSDDQPVGFFSEIGEQGEVRNLTLKEFGVYAYSAEEVGMLAGYNMGTIVNSHIEGVEVEGLDTVGGLVGRNEGSITDASFDGFVGADASTAGGLVGLHGFDAEISSSSSSALVSASGEDGVVGGLVGQSYGLITNSFATGDVSGEVDVGGLVGVGESPSETEQVYATGDIEVTYTTSEGDPYGRAGGLFGQHDGAVTYCYATGDLDFSNWSAGGLAGFASGNSAMEECYSITGVDLRLFVGASGMGATFERLYWDIDTSDATTSSRGDELTTDEFGDDSNFMGWDFDDVWTIGEAPDGEQRPIFQWQE